MSLLLARLSTTFDPATRPRPVFPDIVRGAPTLLAAVQAGSLSFVSVVTPATPLSWSPEHEDVPRPAARLGVAVQQAVTLPVREPAVTVQLIEVDHPDWFASRPGLRADLQDAWTSVDRQPDPPAVSWRGAWPDRVDPRPGLRADLQDASVTVDHELVATTTWDVEHPARVDGHPPAPWSWSVDPERQPDPPATSWRGTWPDRLEAAPGLRADQQDAWTSADRQPDPPDVSWRGSWPDRVDPTPGLRADLQDASVVVDHELAATTTWDVEHPARVDGRTPATWSWLVAPDRQPDPPDVSWQGSWPDRIEPAAGLRVDSQDAWTSADRQPDPPDVSWQGSWPDRIEPARGLSVEIQDAWTSAERQPDPPDASWWGTWPDAVDVHAGLGAASQTSWASPVEAPGAVPDLAWLGPRPDAVDRIPTLRADLQASWTAPVRRPDPPTLVWTATATYPDTILAVPWLGIASQEAWTAPEHRPDAYVFWQVVGPDFLPVVHSAGLVPFESAPLEPITPTPPPTPPGPGPRFIGGGVSSLWIQLAKYNLVEEHARRTSLTAEERRRAQVATTRAAADAIREAAASVAGDASFGREPDAVPRTTRTRDREKPPAAFEKLFGSVLEEAGRLGIEVRPDLRAALLEELRRGERRKSRLAAIAAGMLGLAGDAAAGFVFAVTGRAPATASPGTGSWTPEPPQADTTAALAVLASTATLIAASLVLDPGRGPVRRTGPKRRKR
jgi:hypothetical protein